MSSTSFFHLLLVMDCQFVFFWNFFLYYYFWFSKQVVDCNSITNVLVLCVSVCVCVSQKHKGHSHGSIDRLNVQGHLGSIKFSTKEKRKKKLNLNSIGWGQFFFLLFICFTEQKKNSELFIELNWPEVSEHHIKWKQKKMANG